MTKFDAYVRLLHEGTDVYRPIDVEELNSGLYRIIGPPNCDDETWEIPLNSIVSLCEHTTSSGEIIKVAVAI